MSRKLHIANLSFAATRSDVEVLFACHGAVGRVEVRSYLKTGYGTASAIVEMGSEEQGAAAITALDGRRFFGQVLTVAWASERQKDGGQHSRMFESMNVPDEAELHAPHHCSGKDG